MLIFLLEVACFMHMANASCNHDDDAIPDLELSPIQKATTASSGRTPYSDKPHSLKHLKVHFCSPQLVHGSIQFE